MQPAAMPLSYKAGPVLDLGAVSRSVEDQFANMHQRQEEMSEAAGVDAVRS